jgi:hypothetical protein
MNRSKVYIETLYIFLEINYKLVLMTMRIDKTTITRFIKDNSIILIILGIGAILRFWPIGLNSGFRFHHDGMKLTM